MTEAPREVSMTLNGTTVTALEGELVIEVAERNGIYIPRFCYHHRLDPVGMCRMCLVDVESPRGTALQVSCMLRATDGLVVDTESDAVKKAQTGVLEFLLANHPLDCAVCDKGGECPLQNQTMSHGPGESRFEEKKRNFKKPILLSSLVNMDRERCILCDRCTRFADDVAGDPLIHFQQRGSVTEVNTFPDRPFASYFSGNTVQLCPVGALGALPYRFAARPWDLTSTESTCTTCAVGCRMAVQTSQDEIVRYVGLDVDEVNRTWLCDKGRFGYESLYSEARLDRPEWREGDAWRTASWRESLRRVAEAIQAAGPAKVGFLGGAHLALEDQYLWSKLLRAGIGTDQVDVQLGDGLPPEAFLGVERATIEQACAATTVLLVAPDLREVAPVLYLRLRDAIRNRGLQVVEVSSYPTALSDDAAVSLTVPPGEQAFAIAEILGRGKGPMPATGSISQQEVRAAQECLAKTDDLVVVYGRQNLAESPAPLAEAVGLLARFTHARFLPVVRRANALGGLDMGLAPGILPGRVAAQDGKDWYSEAWGGVADLKGGDATEILQKAARGDLEVLLLCGSDPLQDFPDQHLVQQALAKVPLVVSIDTFANTSNAHAHIRLPATGFGEREGVVSNLEGRLSLLKSTIPVRGLRRDDWLIVQQLAQALGLEWSYRDAGSVWEEIERLVPLFRGITREVLGKAKSGVVVPRPESESALLQGRYPLGAIPEVMEYRVESVSPPQTPYDANAIRLVVTHKLYDGGVLTQQAPHLAELVRVPSVRINETTLKTAGFASGDFVKLRSPRSEVVAKVIADSRVGKGVLALDHNVSEPSAVAFLDCAEPITVVELEKPE